MSRFVDDPDDNLFNDDMPDKPLGEDYEPEDWDDSWDEDDDEISNIDNVKEDEDF